VTFVPRERLLLAAGLLLVPPALAAAFLPPVVVPFSVLAAAGVIVAFAAALAGRRRAVGVSVLFPRRLVLAKGREGSLDFEVTQGAPELLLAPVLPPQLVSTVRELKVSLPGERGAVSWPLRGEVRGDWRVALLRFRAGSPLGLWWVQGEREAGTEISVYPDLSAERKRLAPFFLNRNEIRLHPRRQVGQGREFEKVRPYLPGDSLGDIHWKATAKRGHPVTKEYRIERTQEIYAVVDYSRLSARSAGEEGEPLLERFLTAALTLGLVARRQGDLFGVAAFSDRVTRFVRAGTGAAHFEACRDALYRLHAGEESPDFPELASTLSLRLRRRALLLVLTSLDEPGLGESFLRSMRLLSRRHVVVVAMLRPSAALPAFSAEAASDDDLYRILGGHLLWHDLRELRENLGRSGIELALLENERLCADMVSRYISVKRRQIL
jgi:uncharacterized protein (DUF58 family)